MDTLIFALHLLLWPLCVLIIILILLQGGAGDISSAFGGGGQLDSTLGVGAHRKMAKLTSYLALIFAIAIVILAIPRHGSLPLHHAAAPASTTTTFPGHAATERTPARAPVSPALLPAPTAQPANPATPMVIVPPAAPAHPHQAAAPVPMPPAPTPAPAPAAPVPAAHAPAPTASATTSRLPVSTAPTAK